MSGDAMGRRAAPVCARGSAAHGSKTLVNERTTLQRRLSGALDASLDLAPGIQRSMNRAFWSRVPLAVGASAIAIATGRED